MRAFSIVAAILLLGGMCLAQKINRGDRAKIRETRETMQSLQLDLATVRQIDGVYPDTLKGLVDAKLREVLPKDGWGRDFAYALDDTHGFKLTSWGSDGKAGGEGAGADITWTQTGELREMSAADRAAWQARQEEARFQGSRAVAHARMVAAGGEVVNYRRSNNKWPASLADCKRAGGNNTDKAVNACFTDPWGHEFTVKALPKDNFAIVCWGVDGKEDGLGRDADFVITERDVRAVYNEHRDEWWGWGWDYDRTDWRVQDLAQDVQRFKQRNGKLPNELAELTQAGAPGPDGAPPQAIRNSIPKDQWGNEYVYVRLSEEDFYIVGLGKDGIEGGVKDNKDTIHPEPGKDPNLAAYDDWGGEVAVPVPGPDEDEVRAEVAIELMLDIVDKASAYNAEKGAWPAALADIKDKFVGKEVPKDPWEADFIYTLTKDGEAVTGFTLTCLGSDGAEGGEGHAKDIIYNQAGEPQ